MAKLRNSKWDKASICISGFCLLFAPILFTRSCGLISFKETGTIGDTIGGITAPFTGFLGAILVYMALKEQVKANKIITDQFKEQKIMAIVLDQLKILREDIQEFNFTYRSMDVCDRIEDDHKGVDGIKKALEAISRTHVHRDDDYEGDNKRMYYLDKMSEIEYFLSSISYLIHLVNNSGLESSDRDNLLRIIFETYNSKLRQPLIKNEGKRESKQEKCNHCDKVQGIPESLYRLFDDIEYGIAIPSK